VSVLAIYSPQSKVDANSTMALRAWTQYKAGQPINTKTRVQDEQARAVLYEGKPWSGEKTNNFYKNLMREVDHLIGHPDTQGVTVDMWMMRAAGYTDDVPTAAQYRFIEKETARPRQGTGLGAAAGAGRHLGGHEGAHRERGRQGEDHRPVDQEGLLRTTRRPRRVASWW
jgi:hypothetical protein